MGGKIFDGLGWLGFWDGLMMGIMGEDQKLGLNFLTFLAMNICWVIDPDVVVVCMHCT